MFILVTLLHRALTAQPGGDRRCVSRRPSLFFPGDRRCVSRRPSLCLPETVAVFPRRPSLCLPETVAVSPGDRRCFSPETVAVFPRRPSLFVSELQMDSINAHELQEQIQALTEENIKLQDYNEVLFGKLDSAQKNLSFQSASKRDLSARLIQCEQDKLKISKELLDERIEGNKVREQHEEEIFELKNRILSQEGTISPLQTERDHLRQEVATLSARLEVVERNERDLAEEHRALKSNFLSVSDAFEGERSRSEELSTELLTLAHTLDTLLQERERTHTHALEVQRVRALLSRASRSRDRPEEFEEKKVPLEVNNVNIELEKLRKTYEGQQRHLEEKVVALGKEQQENKRAIQYTRHKLAQQSANLIISQHQLKESEAELSKVQNHLKELNREYRARLSHYIQDITEFVSSVNVGGSESKLKDFVESMLEEIRASYRCRERQLSTAVRTSRKRLQGLSNTYQRLLIAYREQREQILALPEQTLHAGPPEAHFSPEGHELKGETERELQRLREGKAQLESQLRQAQEQTAVFSESHWAGLTPEAWNDVKKELTEIAKTTQEAGEKERAQLITRATVAEEQLSELKEYVDNHLGRYRLEITRLRRLLPSHDGRSHSAGVHKLRPLHTSLRNSSYEI